MWRELPDVLSLLISSEWWYSSPKGADATILNAAFVLNAGLSVFDQFLKAFIQKTRRDLSSELEKCDSRLSLASEEEGGEVSDDLLAEYFGLLDAKSRMVDLLLTRCFPAKLMLVGTAALAAFCMSIPCYDRITLILFLPVLLFYLWCYVEGWLRIGLKVRHLRKEVDGYCKSNHKSDKSKEADVLKSIKGYSKEVKNWCLRNSNALHSQHSKWYDKFLFWK